MLFAFTVAMASCEKQTIQLLPDRVNNKVTFNVHSFEQIPFGSPTKSGESQSITDLCTKINLAVFDGETKEESFVQTAGDEGFGTISLYLKQGTHQVVLIAHNGDASATISTPDKVSFSNKTTNKMTDTFYYYGEITVGKEEQTFNLNLERAVAMVRFDIEDEIPETVKQMKFYYSGGSSTLDPTTGYGCVNSKQTELFDVTQGVKRFEMFTFPHAEKDTLKLTVSALDVNENIIKEREFAEVPVTINMITSYTGEFFAGETSSYTMSQIAISANGEWAGENKLEY